MEQPCSYPEIFSNQRSRLGEKRTRLVVVLTLIMMTAEIGAGILFGSIALLADGLHMASHALALSISVYAYVYARRHASDRDFSFGTGKVNALGGFTGAILLGGFALIMAWESFERLLDPIPIAFNQAIWVAVLGLLVNGASVFLLGVSEEDNHNDQKLTRDHDFKDHNLRSAYLHVLADAFTSIIAILALLAGKYFGLTWMDPLTGILGALLITRWALGLLRGAAHVLLDKQKSNLLSRIRVLLENEIGTAVTDLHVWEIGPGQHSVVVTLHAEDPKSPSHYKRLLAGEKELAHIVVEVNNS